MARAKIVEINIVCELGASNRFSFSGKRASGSEVRVTGAGGQDIALFRKLLEKLAAAYSVDDDLPVEVQNNKIVGVS